MHKEIALTRGYGLKLFGLSIALAGMFLLHTPLAHATIGYYYQYVTCQGSCSPPTGVQIEGPYQAGNQNPPEQQACSNLGFARDYDAFEAPQRDAVDSVACYEYYDARGSIYDFDGAGQEKTIYYGTAAPPRAPTAALTANPTSVAYNGASTLSWSSTNATSCTGSGFSTGGAVSGSVSTGALTANKSYSVTCTGAGGSDTAYAAVSVGQAPAPDLTGGAVTPTTGFANQPISFNSSATNIGNATSGSFPLLFQIQNGAVFNSAYLAGLAQGATGYGSASYTLPAGTYQVRACANYNTSWTNIVSESDYSNNCGPWVTVTVTTPPNPDLTASAVLPSTATAGQSVQLSGTTYNQGTGPAAAYPSIFQIGSGGPVYQQTNSTSPANPGDTNVSLLNHTFSSAGTYQVRLCANFNTSWTNIVSESDYSNNCGPWSTITVSNVVIPPPTPTCTLSASPSTVPSTLTWSSTNATSCTGGGFSTGGATNGSVSTSVSGAYTLSCTGTGGTCSASTNVGGAACTNPTGTLTATPDRVKPGSTATLTYSASGITGSCTVTGPGVNVSVPANSCTVPGGTTPTGAITTQSVYVLTCDGVERARTVVNVLPKIIEF